MKKAIVFLADGWEECEGLITVDILRRAGIEVVMASISGREEIPGSHGIRVMADVLAEDADYDSADMVILPGGKIGTANLGDSSLVRQQCLSFAEDKYVAAICAAPSILGQLGLLKGRKATCYPTFEEKMEGAEATGESVVRDGNIITGQGLGAAIPFALEIVSLLAGPEKAEEIGKKICFKG